MNASVKLLESVLPTTVSLQVSVPESHPSARVLGLERAGSGVVVDSDGLILTVTYVVVGGQEITVSLLDDTVLEGRVAALDFHSGLALVKVSGQRLPPVRPRPSATVKPGDEVFIVAAVGEGGRRVSTGAVSSVAPFDAYWEYHLDRSLVTTAMNPGLGGGGLFTAAGTLVGLVSLDLNQVGHFTMAVPVENYLDHRHELLEHGRRVSRPRRAWVGLFCYELHDHVVVGGVFPGAPGERAGLRPGDVILRVEDEAIGERRALYRRLGSYDPGTRLTFDVFRDRAIQRVEVLTEDAEVFFA